MKIPNRTLKTVAVLAVLAACLSSLPAQARWWIFGKQSDKPEITRVFVGGLSLDEVRDEVTLTRESLEGGMVVLKGYTSKAGSAVALAEVSLDGGASWKEAELGKNGVFLYRFQPKPDEVYTFAFRVVDTTGQKNDPSDIPERKLVYKDVSIGDDVKKAFDSLVQAYQRRDLSSFMDMISQDFSGDYTEFQRGVEADFKGYSNIVVDAIIDSIVTAGKDIKVSFRYNWRANSIANGAQVQPTQQSTVVTFRIDDGKPKLYAMNSPVPFGVSNASRISTGGGGDTSQGQPEVSGTVTLNANQGLVLGTGDVVGVPEGSTGNADLAYFVVNNSGFLVQTMIAKSGGGGQLVNNISLLPESGYANPVFNVHPNTGDFYAVKTPSGKYALLEITYGAHNVDHVTFNFRYRPDGGRGF